MGRLSKLTDCGENGREESCGPNGRIINSLRNLASLSANRVNETRGRILSGVRKQAIMVNMIHGFSRGERLPT